MSLLRRVRLPLLVGVGLSQVGLLLSGAFAARALGVDGRGFLATAMLVPTLAAYVAAASSDALVATLVAQGASPRRTMATAVKVVALPVTVCAIAAAVITHVLLHDPFVDAAAALAVVSTAAVQLATGVFVGLGRDPLVATVQSVGPALYGAATLTAFLSGVTDFRVYAGLWAAAALIAAGLVTGLVVRVVPSAGQAPPSSREFRRRTYIGLFSSYSPLESFRADQIIVLAALGNPALGLYSVALALSNAAKLLGMVGSWTVPATARLEPADRLRRVAVVSIGIFVVGVVFSASFPVLVPLLFGQQFSEAGTVAVVLGIAGALFGVRKVLVESLRIVKREGRATVIELSATVVFVALAVYLASSAGILGVAVALAVAAALTVAGGWAQLLRARVDSPARPLELTKQA